jgi:hypothetical protein
VRYQTALHPEQNNVILRNPVSFFAFGKTYDTFT